VSNLPDRQSVIKQAWQADGVRALLAAPVYEDGRLAGCLVVDSRYPLTRWRDVDIDLLRATAELLGVAWKRRRRSHSEPATGAPSDPEPHAVHDTTEPIPNDYLANVVHEIRTPMNCILGIADILLDKTRGREQRQYLDTIKKAGDALLLLFSDILDHSKLEAGLMTLDPRPTDFDQTVADVVELLRVQARAKGLTLAYERDPAAPRRVVCDAGRLRQVLINLLGNAVKFTAEGRVTLAVKVVETNGRQALVRFRVIDTGIGIEQAALSRIFDRFVQADGSTTRKYGGSGLGLTLCKQLVRLMGGRIVARSLPGWGSVFEFTIQLPCQQRQAAVGSKEHTEPVPPRSADGAHVLVVEDNPVSQKVIVTLLEMLGSRVTATGNGEDACSRARAHCYDLILMDCQMPGMDGYRATRTIRALRGENGRVPIIAMTANVSPDERRRCLDAGMNDFASKPLDRQALQVILERWVNRETASS